MNLEARLYRVTLLVVSVLLATCTLNAQDVAAARPESASTRANGATSDAPTITIDEAKSLMNLLPAVETLRTKEMDVRWDVQAVSTMNNNVYFFFWIYNATAQKEGDIGSISVGNYAVNKYTVDVRVWQVSHDVSFGDDGALVTNSELERLQEELRKKHGITSASIQEYRSAHLAKRIIPREQAQSAVRLPIIQRSSNTAQLTCWKDSDHLISKLGRSPIISSSPGYRAYGEVDAIAFRPKYQETYTGSLCENRVKLFLAKPGESSFQIVLDSDSPKSDCITIEGTDSCEVKGIRLVDWSRDGRLLLADLVLWIYESDALFMRVPIIYDATKNEFIRPDVYHFFDEYYKTDASKANCEYELSTEGFSPDGDLILSASRTPPTSHYDQVFCVDKNEIFQFELGTNKIKRLPFDYKTQHYGTLNTQSATKP